MFETDGNNPQRVRSEFDYESEYDYDNDNSNNQKRVRSESDHLNDNGNNRKRVTSKFEDDSKYDNTGNEHCFTLDGDFAVKFRTHFFNKYNVKTF